MNSPDLIAGSPYRELYQGSLFVIRARSADTTPENLPTLVHAISELRRADIRVLLVCGGAAEIDKRVGSYLASGNGFAHVPPELFRTGVRPVYENTMERLRAAIPELYVVRPSNVPSAVVNGRGRTGIPSSVSDAWLDQPISAIGCIGQASDGEVYVNGDDIAAQLARQYGHEIGELVFLSSQAGLLEKKPDAERPGPISLVTRARLEAILSGEDSTVEVGGSMQRTCEVIRDTLPSAQKVAVVAADRLVQEVFDWKGGGTLFIDQQHITQGPLQPRARALVERVISDQSGEGKPFRTRTSGQMNELLDAHFVSGIKGIPLGGVSVQPLGNGQYELAGLWASYTGNGHGAGLVDMAKRQFENIPGAAELYALTGASDGRHNFTEQSGFACLGEVSTLAGRSDLPTKITGYDQPGRNPRVFVYRKSV